MTPWPMQEMTRREAISVLGAAAAAAAIGPGSAAAAARPLMTRPIPATGEQLPVVGLGTWQTFDVGSGRAERAPLEDVLREFAALGGKVVDSSPMYGRSEEVVGDLAAGLGIRKQLFIATKVWTSGKAAGIEQMKDSMRKLKVDVVDLMQVHNLVDVKAHLDTLAGWKREGRVRYIGITHYTASAHDDVAEAMRAHPVDFIQINYSVGERHAEKNLLPLAKERNVAVIANRPFVEGSLLRRLSGTPLPDFAKDLECASWAQLLLKFVISHPAITCTIPATSKVKHLRDNMGAGLGPLPDEKMRGRIVEAAGTP